MPIIYDIDGSNGNGGQSNSIVNRIAQQVLDLIDVETGGSIVYEQASASSSWVFSNPFNRKCNVSVFIGDEMVETDVFVTNTHINVHFPTPASGYLVIN